MVQFDDVDPAALVTLHALLVERSVTRAARKLGVTQSTLSHRLAGLREALGDPLLVRQGNRLVPTPRAEAIERPLAAALEALRAAVTVQDDSSRAPMVSIAMPDLLAPMLPDVMKALTSERPGTSLSIAAQPPRLDHALAEGTPWFALAPIRDVSAGCVSRNLGEVEFGVVMRRGHPLLSGRLTAERWLAVPQVVVRTGNDMPNLVALALQKRSLTRTVGLEVPTFLAGLSAVLGTDLVMNAPVPVVNEVARRWGLEVRPSPVPLPRIPVAMLWHERFTHAPVHRWARERVFQVVRQQLRA